MAQLALSREGLGNGPVIPNLPAVIVVLLMPLEHPFDRRIWRKAQLLASGAILHSGKRTMASALSIPGRLTWRLRHLPSGT